MKVMQRDFWRAVEAHRNDGRSRAHRRVADQLTIFPSAGAHRTRQDRIESDRDSPGKADLAAMGMAAQEEIEVGTGSLPIYFWRVGDQNRKLVVRYCGRCHLNGVHSIAMCALDL